jgi:hypothetical protein
MTWLPNARYLWVFGAFPTPDQPPVASVWPGYPPGSSLLLAAVYSLAGRAVESAGALLNVACLMVLPGLAARTIPLPPAKPGMHALWGAILGMAFTTLNVSLDWHWVLSSLPDTMTLVAVAAAFVLGAGIVFRDENGWPAKVSFALILAFIVNLRQSGLVVIVLLVGALLAVHVSVRPWQWSTLLRLTRLLFVLCLPSLAVWLCWSWYRAHVFEADAFALRPLAEWNVAAIPDLLAAIGREAVEHWPYAIVALAVTLRGYLVLGRCWLSRSAPAPSHADLLAAILAVAETGYTAFLFATYLGAFSDDEARRAAEFFRYQAELGGAAMIAALALAAERLPSLTAPRATSMLCAAAVAATFVVLPAPGIYPGWGVLTREQIAALRADAGTVGDTIAEAGEPTGIALVTDAGMLPTLITRYEIWSRAPRLITRVEWLGASDDIDLSRQVAETLPRFPVVVGLKDYGGVHCVLLAEAATVDLVGSSSTERRCSPLRPRTAGDNSPARPVIP